MSFVVFFTVPLFLGSLFEKIFGSELLFLRVGVGLVCFGVVLPMFLLLLFAFSLPKLSLKNSLDVRSGVFGLSSVLPLFLSPTSSFLFFSFLRERQLR